MRSFPFLPLTLCLACSLATPVPAAVPSQDGATLDIAIASLRSAKGMIRICLTRNPAHFPDCTRDPAARHLSVKPADAGQVSFDKLPYGDYALSLIHDENGNGRLDTAFGIPREGFGFSRNPVVRFGPPRFKAAGFAVDAPEVHQRIVMKYVF